MACTTVGIDKIVVFGRNGTNSTLLNNIRHRLCQTQSVWLKKYRLSASAIGMAYRYSVEHVYSDSSGDVRVILIDYDVMRKIRYYVCDPSSTSSSNQ